MPHRHLELDNSALPRLSCNNAFQRDGEVTIFKAVCTALRKVHRVLKKKLCEYTP